MSAIDQALAKMSAEMQAAGASQNPYYLAQLAAQDAAKTTGGNLEDLMDEANTRLGLPVAPRAKAAETQAPTVAKLPAEEAKETEGTGSGGSGGLGDSHGSAESGPMGAGLEGTLGDLSSAMSALGPLGSMLGIGALGAVSPIGTVLGSLVTASQASRALGGEYGYDPMLGVATEADLQGMMDSFGYGSRQEATARSAISAARAEAQQLDNDYTGVGRKPGDPNRSFGGPTPDGWAGERSAPNATVDVAANPSDPNPGGVSMSPRGAPAPGTPGFGFGGWGDTPTTESPTDPESGANGPGGESGQGPSGQGDPGSDASGQGGQGESGFARKGGVFKSSGKAPRKLTWGEPGTGGETLVAVPETMKQFGKQPNEDAVIAALETLLAELKGKR